MFSQAADERQKVRDAAFRLLAVRARSRRELEQRLRQKKLDGDLITQTLDDFRDKGYQSDEDFACQYAGEKWRNKGWGPRRLESALAAKGIAPGLAQRVISETVGEADLVEAILPLAQKHWRSSAGQPDQKRRQRLSGFLQRRGYGWEVIGPVMDKLA